MHFHIKSGAARYILSFVIFLAYVPAYPHIVFCYEEYYIDDQVTLLYKVINWWYDCLPEECDIFCGDAVKCTNQGNARIEYNENVKLLRFTVQYGLADMLSVIDNCAGCTGPSHLKCIWQDPKYFEGAKPAAVSNLSRYDFYGIDGKQAQAIKSIGDAISFVVEGNICGLLKDGTISLHQSGAFLRSCPKRSDNEIDNPPISVKIMNAKTNRMLARYLATRAE